LNFADIFAIHGLYSATPQGSFIPGLEFSGTVESVGQGVEGFSSGMKVLGVTRFGGYVSHLNLLAQYVIPIPEGWDFNEAAAFPVQALTAYYALHPLGNLQAGQAVLIHSAAGGVGLWANRIAKKSGAFTIGTVGNPSKLPLLQQEGYDFGIVRDRNLPERVKECLGQRELNLVLECIGGRVFRQSYELLAPMGRIVTYGSAAFTSHGASPSWIRLILPYLFRPRIDPLRMPSDNKSVMGFNLIWLYERAELMHRMMDEIQSLNLPRPLVGHLFPFDQLTDALKLFQSGLTSGKVVVRVYE
jgi:alcohol dehydrogenase